MEINEVTMKEEPIYESTLEKPIKDIHELTLNNTLRPFNLSCEFLPNGYIHSLKNFGFLYTLNYETDDFSEANVTCRAIENPFDDVVAFNYTEEE